MEPTIKQIITNLWSGRRRKCEGKEAWNEGVGFVKLLKKITPTLNRRW